MVKLALMKPSIQKLQKFLKLEADRGYDNRAVVGGLNRMLDPWESEARAEGVSEDLVQAVLEQLREYQNFDTQTRAERLSVIWQRMIQETGKPLPNLPDPSAVGKQAKTQPPRTRKRTTKEGEQAPSLSEARSYSGEREAAEPVSQARPQPEASHHGIIEREPQPREPEYEGPPAALNAPVTVLQGVGPRLSQTLSRLGIYILRDMLYYFPRRYDDYSQLKPINRLVYGEEVTVIGMVHSVHLRPFRGGSGQMVEATVGDGSGNLRVTWFNQPWIAKRLRNGTPVVLSGKVEQYLGRPVMNNPEMEPLESQNLHTNRIVPVYSLTANITQRWLRKTLHEVVTYWAPRVYDFLPQEIREPAGLMRLPDALREVHFPSSAEKLQAARRRLAFDEIFLLQLGVQKQKRAWQNRPARTYPISEEWLSGQLERLPYSLTNAQKQALDDIFSDLASGHPMNRLLQGDVGSGKTVVAALGAGAVVSHGPQAAFLAPTGILAEQHYRNLLSFLAEKNGRGPELLNFAQVRLLVGATLEPEKQAIREGLASGEIKVIVGTHALLEEPVVFADLQIAVIDEQHRFGVEQRALLRAKGDNPHLLVMTATPIPRSLALTLYGDLDLTVIDEMPPGRQKTETFVLLPRERERAYSMIHSQLAQGNQAFIIYPFVEENENGENLSAVQEYERLQKEIFPRCKVGLLHGRLKSEDKDEVMAKFRDREIDVLVSTTVVEVGVDIPKATVMLVEGANRFGLAQLHQLRGRVGRGSEKSFCLLIPEKADSVENERLKAMAESSDGFVLAERDLAQRGPGQFLGTRQSGLPDELRLSNLTDIRLISQARQYAQEVFERDPGLEKPEYRLMASTLHQFWGEVEENGKGDIS
jgi:ATP-dependent DNA helicase RecG